jgi:hypothetical protein
MPTKTSTRPVTATRQQQRGRVGDQPTLPGLADALEVYRRIVASPAARPARRPGRPPRAVRGAPPS